ncbi:MAG TPA: sodium/solute symporter [Candidatus Hydrogenedentes bacterium]|nr:sodium/solute symporter [Candidatus Hydrogenedentota bacterium]HPG67704.1 sodium/solute symporter [Candidatus Hydrogenedentota bacterium]
MRLGLLDTVILVAYLAIVAIIGFRVGRREKKTSHDYFLAGSRLPWYAVGLSMVASSISTEQFMGEVGFAYSHGMAVANWEWLVFPALTVLIWVFAPLYIRHRVTTMPEFLERRYGVGSRTIFALLTVASYAVVNLALVLYSGGLALNQLFGIPMPVCVLALAAVTGAYTIYGGLSSVVWTDVFQCVLLLLGGILVFVLGLAKVDGGWSAIIGTGDRAHLILPADDPHLPWTSMVVLALCTNIWYYCTNQYINQRCLGAKDEWHAKMGMIFSGFLGLVLALAVSFPGLIAYALNPELEDPNTAYPYLVTTIVPPALQGLLLAALVSAIMSTISSLLNSTATVFTVDIYQRFFRKDASEERLIVVGRYAGVAVMATGLACVPVVGLWEHIFAYCQEIWVLLAGPAVAVFLVGVLWRRATSAAATATMAMSFPLMAVPFLQKVHPFLPGGLENILVLGGVVFVLSVALMVVVSLFSTAPTTEKANAVHWSPAMLRLPPDLASRHAPLHAHVGFWWLILGCIYATVYAVFW